MSAEYDAAEVRESVENVLAGETDLSDSEALARVMSAGALPGSVSLDDARALVSAVLAGESTPDLSSGDETDGDTDDEAASESKQSPDVVTVAPDDAPPGATPGDDDADGEETADDGEAEEYATVEADVAAEDLPRVDLDLSGECTEAYPLSHRESGHRWLLWQYRDDRKIPRNPRWGYDPDEDAAPGEWSKVGAKDPRGWFEFDAARRWTEIDDDLSLGYYLASPERDEWDDDEKYDVDPETDVPDEVHAGLADFDDIRDEEGNVAPKAVPWLERFAVSYEDWSPSGTGAHVIGSFSLPEGCPEVHVDLSDENFPDAELELYEGRRYTTVSGRKIPGSADDIEDVQDVVDALCAEYPEAVEEARKADQKADRDPSDEDWEPTRSRDELAEMRTTNDYQDVIDAVRQLHPSDLPLRSEYVEDENAEFESWSPGYRSSSSGLSLKHAGRGQFIDMKKQHAAFGVLSLFAAEVGILHRPWDDLRGDDWKAAVDRAREAGAPIPEYEPPAGEETVAIPFGQLDAQTPAERREAAADRGHEPPTTAEARGRLREAIYSTMRESGFGVIEAPTSLGKSHTIAATKWGADDLRGVTGGDEVIHLSATKDARDDAVETARQNGVDPLVLRGRKEACSVAGGKYDPRGPDEEDDGKVVTIHDTPASDWLDMMCDGRGVALSDAHVHLAEHNDQGHDELPCCEETGECPAIAQWEEKRERDDYDLIMATHPFAHVPSLRIGTHLIFDEQPDFNQLSTDPEDGGLDQRRIERAVTALLKELGTPLSTWGDLVRAALSDDLSGDLLDEYNTTLHRLENKEPDREFYFKNPDAHTLAQPIAQAVAWSGETLEGRRVGTMRHNPPRLDARANDSDAWNLEWVTVVLKTEGRPRDDPQIRGVFTTPSLGAATSVIGLDAFPTLGRWHVNTTEQMELRTILSSRERQLWRRYERGLRIVQVGNATRSLVRESAFNPRAAAAIIEALRERYSDEFRTFITTMSAKAKVEGLMKEAGVDPDAVEGMHYGAEKSRNDFAGESVGFIHGCVDPGDDFVLDHAAVLEYDVTVPYHECEKCEGEGCDDDPRCNDGQRREAGRTFEGADAKKAAELLASVRESHVAQAAGRYARSPDDPENTATVFVQTDALPEGFADVEVPGVVWSFGKKQRAVVEVLREATEPLSAREMAEAADISKAHARKTLNRLVEADAVQVFEGEGKYGANLYSTTGLPTTGCVDLEGVETLEEIDGLDVETATAQLATRKPTGSADTDTDASAEVVGPRLPEATEAAPDGQSALDGFEGGEDGGAPTSAEGNPGG